MEGLPKPNDEDIRKTLWSAGQRELLSSARQALESAAVAPGDERTWKTKRPRRQRDPLEEVLTMVPPDPLVLDIELMMKTLRSAKKGSAKGPSGMTVEHLRPLLESGICTALLGEVATQFARGQVPEEVLPSVRLGRMTALQKSDGGVRGILVGDVFRRLVGRTLAKQFAEQGQAATHPFQYVLSTRAGTECVAHVVQALTSLDPSTIILSIDCVGAHDSISNGDVSWPHGHDGRREVGAFRETLLRQRLNVHIGKTRSGMFGTCCKEKVANKETP